MLRRLILVAVALLLVAGAGAWFLTPPAAAPAIPPLRLGVMDWPGFYPYAAAAVDGGWEREGSAVQVVTYPDNPSLNAALKRGDIDIACGAATDALLLRSQGVPVRIIAVADTSDGADVLLARPGVHRLGETPDQRISFEGVNSFSHLFVLESLQQAGVPEVSVRTQDLSAMAVPEALLAGRLDVGHTWGPLAEAAVAKGCRILVRAGDYPGVVTDIIMARQDLLDSRTTEVQRFVHASYRIQESWRHREADLLATAATWLGKTTSDLLPLRGSVVLVDRDDAFRRLSRTDVPGSLLHMLDEHRTRLARRGQFPKDIQATDVVDVRFLAP